MSLQETENAEIFYLEEGQTGGEVIFNEGMNLFDALTHCCILDRDLTAPPGSPSNGDVYLVDATATGDWAGYEDYLAIYYNDWIFRKPWRGLFVWVHDEAKLFVNTATKSSTPAWQQVVTQGSAIADLNQTISATPTQAEVQAISDKIDEILAELRTIGAIAT